MLADQLANARGKHLRVVPVNEVAASVEHTCLVAELRVQGARRCVPYRRGVPAGSDQHVPLIKGGRGGLEASEHCEFAGDDRVIQWGKGTIPSWAIEPRAEGLDAPGRECLRHRCEQVGRKTPDRWLVQHRGGKANVAGCESEPKGRPSADPDDDRALGDGSEESQFGRKIAAARPLDGAHLQAVEDGQETTPHRRRRGGTVNEDYRGLAHI